MEIIHRIEPKERARVNLRTVNFNYLRGGIALSKRLCDEEKAQVGMRLLVAHNTENGCWYLAFSNDMLGYNLIGRAAYGKQTLYKDKQYGLRCVCTDAVRAVLDDLDCTRAATFIVATRAKIENGVRWYKILTDKPVKMSNMQISL